MAALTDEAVKQLLQEQRALFERGATLPYAYRARQLAKLKGAILANERALEDALAADLGKSRQESYLTEVGFVLSGISYAQRHLKKWMKPVRVKQSLAVFPSAGSVVRQPYGSALIIGPYNYPFQLLFEPLVAAIAAGNCAVLSPSDAVPNVSRVIRAIVEQTFDRAYVFCAEGGIEDDRALLRGRFDKIFFTGSAAVGRIVMRAAAETLTPVTLELGGKSPVIVDETAKLHTACERIAWGKFMNAGQTCVAPDYVFVHRSAFPRFIEGLTAAIRSFYGADAQASPDYGRIVNERHMRRLLSILREDESSVVYGGESDLAARFIAPTILCPESIEGAACMREEIFGPLLPVFAYEDLREVIAYIRAREKPLALYIFSENVAQIENILRSTSSGGACINDTVSHILNPALPFGGVGESGMGSYHGEHGFNAFSHARSVLRRSTRISVRLAYPPFTEKKGKWIGRLFK